MNISWPNERPAGEAKPDVRAISDGEAGAYCTVGLVIINGVIHEVLQSKKLKPVLLQFYDYSQMLQEAISDIFDTGVDDDNLALLYNANQEIDMAVKTANGLSDRQTVNDIVLQGDKWGSILASVQVDKMYECWIFLFLQKYLTSGVLRLGGRYCGDNRCRIQSTPAQCCYECQNSRKYFTIWGFKVQVHDCWQEIGLGG